MYIYERLVFLSPRRKLLRCSIYKIEKRKEKAQCVWSYRCFRHGWL